ncbi:MAG TPA: type II toxin-antitoxin system antitoxin SocA domain-containing protein [Candidatus Elarobacter sp.]|nr:type II toxin-antitoxin system antitoxin SocA domain-containing protein [Candidatus Elarobacter sp.]
MPKSIDVAEYILQRRGCLPAMKLQKLVYYCQAWSLAWDGRALFDDEIQAWANGPVAPLLYVEHHGKSTVCTVRGDPSLIECDTVARETVDSVLQFYARKSKHWLYDLTHAEVPWREARGNLPAWVRGSRPIPNELMASYYSKLAATKSTAAS